MSINCPSSFVLSGDKSMQDYAAQLLCSISAVVLPVAVLKAAKQCFHDGPSAVRKEEKSSCNVQHDLPSSSNAHTQTDTNPRPFVTLV